MNDQNIQDNQDNISAKKKKQPSKAAEVVKMIFFVISKILSYILNITFTILLIGILTGLTVVIAFALYIDGNISDEIPSIAVMSSEADLTTIIYYAEYDDPMNKTNPRWVELERLHGSENRLWVKYKDIEKTYLVQAFLALEDHRFMEHNGVDWRRTAAAALNFINPSGRLYGGSTITQQLVKIMTEDADVRIQRKIQEMLRAMNLEKKTSKSDILEAYLNTVNLSGGSYGVQAAAEAFFNKDVTELNLIECAAIAAIVQSPTNMNPVRRPERNKARRDECLKNMLEYGYITQEEYDEAYDKELVLNQAQNANVENVKSYYVDQIITDVMADLMEKYSCTKEMASRMIYSGGLKIYCCMDLEIQSIMDHVYGVCLCRSEEECLANEHDQRKNPYFPSQSEGAILYQSAMVVIDPYNGDLLGIVGGRGRKVQRGLNRASGSQRSAGSSIKPVGVYAPALERGLIDFATPLEDSPSMKIGKSMWPTNYGGGYSGGKVTLRKAIKDSLNTTAVRVLNMITPEYSFRFMHDDLNMKSLVREVTLPDGTVKSDIGPSPLALGGMTNGVSVYELTAAYSIFINNGVFSKPRSYTVVKDSGNTTILERKLEQKSILNEANAYIMTKLLCEVVRDGTAKGLPMANNGNPAKKGIEVAGKTGTTNDEIDRWFIGYTPYYLCGSWFGYDQPKSMNVPTGMGNPPLVLFNYVMNEIHEIRGLYDNPKTFEKPSTVVPYDDSDPQVLFCRDSGKAPVAGCHANERVESGYFERGREPSEPCHYHSSGSSTSTTEPPETTTEPTTTDTGPTETTTTDEQTTTELPVVDTTEPTTEDITRAPTETDEPTTESPTVIDTTDEPTTEPPEPITEPSDPITEPPYDPPTEPVDPNDGTEEPDSDEILGNTDININEGNIPIIDFPG